MPNTQNRNHNIYTPKQKRVLDLEMKYFNILFQVFSKKSFSHSLNQIMIEINSSWQRIHKIWGKSNVVDLAVERLINYKVHNDPLISPHIQSVYPSPISSDTAFITKDAVINIDSKTTDVYGNPGDWHRQRVGCNQHSFDNKLNFKPPQKPKNMKITALLKQYHGRKPVLSYFLSTLYYSDQKNKTDSWYDDNKYSIKPYHMKAKKKNNTQIDTRFLQNIRLSCMPHHEVSSLFQNDLISGVKVYKPANVSNPKHTDEMRVVCSDIKDRYDSRGKIWEGVKTWVI